MNNTKLIQWVLRIAVFGSFLGHGMFALQGKEKWVQWMMKFGENFGGFDIATATQLLFCGWRNGFNCCIYCFSKANPCSNFMGCNLGFLDCFNALASACRRSCLGFRGTLAKLGCTACPTSSYWLA